MAGRLTPLDERSANVLNRNTADPEQWYVTTVGGDLFAEEIELVLPHDERLGRLQVHTPDPRSMCW